jgi:hypothetical protein
MGVSMRIDQIYQDGQHYDLFFPAGQEAPRFWLEQGALFKYNGFGIEHKYGAYDRCSFDADSTMQLFVLTLA